MTTQRTRSARHLAWAFILGAAALIAPVRAHAEDPAAPADSLAVPVPPSPVVSAPETAATAPSVAPTSPAHAAGNAPLATVLMVRLTGKPRTVLRTGPSDGHAIAG